MEEGAETRTFEEDPGPVADSGPNADPGPEGEASPESEAAERDEADAESGPDAEPGAETEAGPDADPEGDAPAGELASAELAALYIQQGEYERGIGMYRTLLEADPDNSELREALDDADALADLLILRSPEAKMQDQVDALQAGFEQGYRQGLAERGALTGEERIARLSAWLERVKERIHAH
jgi:hypothetical protein